MKYRLKKELLFSNVGTEVRIFYGSSMTSILFNTETETVDFHLVVAEIPKPVWNWIEEIKPREWTLYLDKDDNVLTARPGDNYIDKHKRIERTIQVHEVIK